MAVLQLGGHSTLLLNVILYIVLSSTLINTHLFSPSIGHGTYNGRLPLLIYFGVYIDNSILSRLYSDGIKHIQFINVF